MEQFTCLRCGTAMRFAGTERLQRGKTSWLLGDLPNLLAGAREVSVMECPHCGKLEFFSGSCKAAPEGDALPQRSCPNCGASHDFDYPRCPLCGHNYGPQDTF